MRELATSEKTTVKFNSAVVFFATLLTIESEQMK
jgi:hypothetical protein